MVSRASATVGPPCGQSGVYVRADKVVSWIERVTHVTVPRTTCKGAADESTLADEPVSGDSGGCAAGGGSGGLMLLLGALAASRHRRARPRP